MNTDITQQTEPVRKSFLTTVIDNLSLASRDTYVHRLIYIGEHKCGGGAAAVARCIEKSINLVNEGYHDEQLSGLLICYPKYFCHMVEGSEDCIIKHLKALTEVEQCQVYLGTMKYLICYHHINQRFLPGWLAITGLPSPLKEKLDPNCELKEAIHHVYTCIDKLYHLAYYERIKLIRKQLRTSELPNILQETTAAAREKSSTPPPKKERPKLTPKEDVRKPQENDERQKSTVTVKKKKGTRDSFKAENYQDCLPEYGLLEFLIQTKHTASLYEYIHIYGAVAEQSEYKDMIWPVPTDFIPYNVFDLPVDPIPDLSISNEQQPNEDDLDATTDQTTTEEQQQQ